MITGKRLGSGLSPNMNVTPQDRENRRKPDLDKYWNC